MADETLREKAQARQGGSDSFYHPDRMMRAECMRRASRDTAVTEAMQTHSTALKGEISQRLVMEIANLAAHNALLQYSTYIEMDIARIESADRARFDEMATRGMPPIILDPALASVDQLKQAQYRYGVDLGLEPSDG